MSINLQYLLRGFPKEIVSSVNKNLQVDVSSYAARKIVFRPGDPNGARQNIYTKWLDCWSAVKTAVQFDEVELEFDTTFSGSVSSVTGDNEIVIPSGTWDFNKVLISSPLGYAGHTISTPDNCFIKNLNAIRGQNLTLLNKSTLTSPYHGFLHMLILGGNGTYFKVAPGAKPFFVVDDAEVTPGFGVIYSPYALGHFGYSNEGEDPILDLNGNTAYLGGMNVFDNTLIDTSLGGTGSVVIPTFGSTTASVMGWNFPALPSTVSILLDNLGDATNVIDRSRYSILDVVPVTGSYTATYGELVRVNTGAEVSVTLPKGKGPVGEKITIMDATGTAAAHNITVLPSSGNTIRGTSSYVINVDRSCKEFICLGNGDWEVK